jgi:tRNA (cmo5U34)-methyltransferase
VLGYDDRIPRSIPGYEAMHDSVSAILANSLPETGHLLVVGAGTGKEILTLGAQNESWRFTGVDPSGDMLAVARGALHARGMSGRARLQEGTINDLPKAEEFDGATALLVMHFLPDDGTKAGFLRAIAGRLKPGAPLVLVDQHGQRPSRAFDECIEQWKCYQLARGMPPEDVEANMTRRLGANHYIPEPRVLALFEEAGFEPATRFFHALVIGGWWARRIG